MVSVNAALGYIAVGYCVWQLLAAIANAACSSPHRLPIVPKGVRPPSHVDVLRPYFVTSKGLALYVRKWLPRFDRQPRGVFFLLHGLGEHAGRYDHVGRALAREGFAVFSVDHQGHGRSDGERMYADSVQDLSQDFLEFVQHVLDGPKPGDKNASVVDADLDAHAHVHWKDLPRFAMGHSMGGLLTLQLVELSMENALSWNGVILSAPALWLVSGGGVPGWVRVLSWMPRLNVPRFEFSKIGNDVEVFKRWSRDSLIPNQGATARIVSSLITEGDRFARVDNELAKRFPSPLYVVVGEQDTLTYPQGAVKFYTACAQKDKTLSVIPNAPHEVLNIEGYEKILESVIDWAVARL